MSINQPSFLFTCITLIKILNRRDIFRHCLYVRTSHLQASWWTLASCLCLCLFLSSFDFVNALLRVKLVDRVLVGSGIWSFCSSDWSWLAFFKVGHLLIIWSLWHNHLTHGNILLSCTLPIIVSSLSISVLLCASIVLLKLLFIVLETSKAVA